MVRRRKRTMLKHIIEEVPLSDYVSLFMKSVGSKWVLQRLLGGPKSRHNLLTKALVLDYHTSTDLKWSRLHTHVLRVIMEASWHRR